MRALQGGASLRPSARADRGLACANGSWPQMSLQYFEAPPEALEAPDEMRGWAQRGLRAALRARKPGQARQSGRKVARRRT